MEYWPAEHRVHVVPDTYEPGMHHVGQVAELAVVDHGLYAKYVPRLLVHAWHVMVPVVLVYVPVAHAVHWVARLDVPL